MYKLTTMGLIITLMASTEAAPGGAVGAAGGAEISGVSIEKNINNEVFLLGITMVSVLFKTNLN